MKWDIITYFLAVAEEQSFSKAAEKLFFTQSNLSRRIAALEQDLNVTLFDREGKTIALTPAGKLLYERSKVINNMIEDTLNEIRTLDKKKERILNVACGWEHMAILSDISALLAKTYPHIRINPISTPYRRSNMDGTSADLRFTSGLPGEYEDGILLLTYYEKILMNGNHPLACKNRVTFQDIKDMMILLDTTTPNYKTWKKQLQQTSMNVVDVSSERDIIYYVTAYPLTAVAIGSYISNRNEMTCAIPFAEGLPQEFRLRNRLPQDIDACAFVETAKTVVAKYMG